MKMHAIHKLSAAMALASLTAATHAHADPGKGTVGNMTIRLVEQFTDPSLPAKDKHGRIITPRFLTYENFFSTSNNNRRVETYEYGSKITTFRISNKEFLEVLVEEGVIPEIRGWAVVVVEADDEFGIFIEKRGERPIDVSEFLIISGHQSEAEAFQENYRFVSTEVFSSGVVTERETGNFRAFALVDVSFQAVDVEMELQGMLLETQTLRTFGMGDGRYTQWIPGARNINNITGWLSFDDGWDDEFPSVITGSISAAAGRQVDLSNYGL